MAPLERVLGQSVGSRTAEARSKGVFTPASDDAKAEAKAAAVREKLNAAAKKKDLPFEDKSWATPQAYEKCRCTATAVRAIRTFSNPS